MFKFIYNYIGLLWLHFPDKEKCLLYISKKPATKLWFSVYSLQNMCKCWWLSPVIFPSTLKPNQGSHQFLNTENSTDTHCESLIFWLSFPGANRDLVKDEQLAHMHSTNSISSNLYAKTKIGKRTLIAMAWDELLHGEVNIYLSLLEE